MTHSFDTDIARLVGVNAAVIYNSIFWWCAKHKANNTNHYDGNWWVYNSRKSWCELFPYLSDKNIQTALGKLVSSGLVIKGNYNANQLDRTCWYAIADISRLTIIGQPLTKIGQCIDQNQPTNTIISTNNISTIEKEKYIKEKETIVAEQSGSQWSETMRMHHQLSETDVAELIAWSYDQVVLLGNKPSRGDILRYANKHVAKWRESQRVSSLKSRSIDDRRMEFWERSQQYVDKFSQELRKSFVLYYTKPSEKVDGLMKFEETREFDMLSTLKQWETRDEQRRHTIV